MRRYIPLIVIVIFGFAMALAMVSPTLGQDGGEKPHWTYEGEEGPEHWGDLSEEYALCGEGMSQSPIDFTDISAEDVLDIEFNYNPSALNIVNNGHAIQVNYDDGSSITVDGTTYNLLQFHFHLPSEHTIDGEYFAMELHLVHADADGNLAVVGVMLAEEMEDNDAYAELWANAPTEEGEVTVEGTSINAADLLPDYHGVFTYSGSLTTPPCSEGVLWMVMTEPSYLSSAQINAFAENFFEGTNRPVQPINERDIAFDFWQ